MSQETLAPATQEADLEDGAPVRRPRSRALLWAGAAGIGVLAALGGVWVFRVPLVEAAIRNHLAARGVDGDFRIERLDLSGADLAAIRLGAEDLPDAAIGRVELTFAWNGVFPVIDTVRLVEPRLRAAWTDRGLDLGGLDDLLASDGPPGPRPALPPMRVEIVDGQLLLNSPFGAVSMTLTGEGRIGENFRALAQLEETDRASARGALENVQARLALLSDAEGAALDLHLAAGRAELDGVALDGLTLRVTANAPLDLANARAIASWRVAAIDGEGIEAQNLQGRAELSGNLADQGLAFADWRGALRAEAERFEAANYNLTAPVAAISIAGDSENGAGRLTLASSEDSGSAQVRGAVNADADLRLAFGETIGWRADGALRMPRGRLTDRGAADLQSAWPSLAGTPLDPMLSSAGESTTRALRDFALVAPWRVESSRIVLDRPIELTAATGARAILRPASEGGEMFALRFADGALAGGAMFETSGGGLPDASFNLARIEGGGERPIVVRGALAIPDWRPQNGRLAAPDLDAVLTLDGAKGQLHLSGAAAMSGPAGSFAVTDLMVPLDLVFAWGDGFEVSTVNDRCMVLSFGELAGAGLDLANGVVEVCPRDGAYYRASARDAVSGGFTVANLDLSGHMAGEPAQTARLAAGAIDARFSGASTNLTLDIEADDPRLSILMEQSREIAFSGARLTARSLSTPSGWRAEGVLEDGRFFDPALPADLERVAMRWTAAPREEDVVIDILDGAGRLVDRPAPGAAPDAAADFKPLLLADVNATLADGRFSGEGRLLLEADQRQLGAFDALHLFEPAAGEAHLRIRDLAFDPQFQPSAFTEYARGQLTNVRGALEADVDVAWAPDDFTARGRVKLDSVSLSTPTLPIIENVSGEIVFDDLFTLSTPPGQRITVGELNPGISVKDGLITFQLLSEGRLNLESAHWPFAGGALDVEPRTLTLGAEVTEFTLMMSHVEVSELLALLNVPDLAATGRVRGRFPLVLSATKAEVRDGALTAEPPGGAIIYTGEARRRATGLARFAFDALGGFRYDSLELTLNGDIAGDVVTNISFRGVNETPMNLDSLTPGAIPVMGVNGLPFRFRVSITAPFRSLAGTFATFTSGTAALELARQRAPRIEGAAESAPPTEATPPVDPPPPAPNEENPEPRN